MISSDYINVHYGGMLYRLRRYHLDNPYRHREVYIKLHDWVRRQHPCDVRLSGIGCQDSKGMIYADYVFINENLPELVTMAVLSFPEIFKT